MSADASELRRNWSAHMRSDDEFISGGLIGKGTFGQVYRGHFRSDPDRPVAKRLLGTAANEDEISVRSQRFFMRELEVFLTMVPTPTICEFLGYSILPDKSLFTEYLPNGSLESILASPNAHWTDTARSKTIFGFACGMMHLHNHGAMHRYLSPKNILFDANWEPRLVDFGFAKTELDTLEQTQLQATSGVPYLAPEVLGNEEYGPAIDVYAFAMIVWQIVAGQPPWNGLNAKKIADAVGKNRRPPMPPGTDPVLSEIIRECWHAGAGSRPQFYEIVKTLLHHDDPLFPNTDMREYRVYRDRVFSRTFKSQEAQLCFDAEDIAAFKRVCASADATGNIADCTRAGLMLDSGRGTPRDLVAARRYLTRSAEGNDPVAMYQLAKKLASGRFGRLEEAEAFRWMEAAAAIPGNLTAKVEFAMMLVTGMGAPPDPQRGIALLEEVAAPPFSDGDAQFQLAKLLLDGEYCAQDLARARRLFGLAADRGLEGGAINLSIMELRGEGGPKDVNKAIRTLEQAVDKGSSTACLNLAVIREGKQVPPEFKQEEEARRLYQQAEELGHPKILVRSAMAKFKTLAKQTNLDPRARREEQRKVLEMLKRAADAGDLMAMSNYGKLRIEGYGMRANPYDGYHYLIRAAELGFWRALELLAEFVGNGTGGMEINQARTDRLAECARLAGGNPGRPP